MPDSEISTLARLDADRGLATPIADATTRFGLEVFQQGVAEAGTGNFLVSPVSIAIALAMTRAGAVGQTASEMDLVLHLDGLDDPHGAWNALDQLLESRAGTVDHFGEPAEVALSVVNRLWGQKGFGFEQPFLDLLAQQYGAGMHLVDYAEATEAARMEINEWVSEETQAKIPELIPPGALTGDTRLVLTNAVYFKAPWANRFSDTVDLPFTTLGGTEVAAPTMALSEFVPYASGEGWEAVELFYAGRQLKMTIVVPAVGRFEEVSAGMSSDLFRSIDAGDRTPLVNLSLPSFRFRSPTPLNGILEELGMPTAFDLGSADFSALTREERLYCLLYTSPSPRDATLSRMPSSA